jgi:hypothetical protein
MPCFRRSYFRLADYSSQSLDGFNPFDFRVVAPYHTAT